MFYSTLLCKLDPDKRLCYSFLTVPFFLLLVNGHNDWLTEPKVRSALAGLSWWCWCRRRVRFSVVCCTESCSLWCFLTLWLWSFLAIFLAEQKEKLCTLGRNRCHTLIVMGILTDSGSDSDGLPVCLSGCLTVRSRRLPSMFLFAEIIVVVCCWFPSASASAFPFTVDCCC